MEPTINVKKNGNIYHNKRGNDEKKENVKNNANNKMSNNNEKIYKPLQDITKNSEIKSFNQNVILWSSSFFSLKEDDLKIFGNEIKKRNIFKRCFQRIHKNKRRRCMSFNPYRVPLSCKKVTLDEMLISEPKIKKKKKKKKKIYNNPNMPHDYFFKKYILRAKKKKWLETHLYHSKKFKMTDIYGYKLALKNCDKISRRIFRYHKRKSLIHDMSYVEVLQISGNENDIIHILKKITNIEQANMLREKYLLGILLGKIFIYKYENIQGKLKYEKNNFQMNQLNQQENHNLFKNNDNNFFNAKNCLICPAYFLWRSMEKKKKKSKKGKKKSRINTTNQVNEYKNDNEATKIKNKNKSEVLRDLWIFIHPVCLKEIIENFEIIISCEINNISHKVDIKHIKNICMYELIGPNSFNLLTNILKVKSKYIMKEKKDIYHYKYENITLPKDFVIPMYAILPKTIGPFLLNYKINEKLYDKLVNNIDKQTYVESNKINEQMIKENRNNKSSTCLNALNYLREKNEKGNKFLLKSNNFSPYDNNILMNDKIKQNVIKTFKINKYEHVRSRKKKKVKLAILKMLRNNKNIAPYDVIKEKKKKNEDEKVENDSEQVLNNNINEKKQNNTFLNLVNEVDINIKKGKYSSTIFDNNNILNSYVDNFLDECKKEEMDKNNRSDIWSIKQSEQDEILTELQKTKEQIKNNSQKYIKIPILIINKSDNNNNKRFFILCPAKKKSSVLFHLLVRNGSIAIGLKEREKIFKCLDFLCYPKDFPDSVGGIFYNNLREQLSKKKHFKKPINKRVNYYCLGINNPFNYSWISIYPHTNNNVKIIRVTDSYNAFLIKTFLNRFVSISLNKLNNINDLEKFYTFMEDIKSKFYVLSSYFISVYVYAYKKGTPKRLSHICSMPLKKLIKFFIQYPNTKKIQKWLVHKKIEEKKIYNSKKIEKPKEPVISRYKNRVVKKRELKKNANNKENISYILQTEDKQFDPQKCENNNEEIILASKKIIGFVSSGGHVLSKGYGYGVAHISFYLFLENILYHIFVLKLITSNEIKANQNGTEFTCLALMRNINSSHYYHVWLSMVSEGKYLPF
ncbi:ribonucleases P/MRP protein subunit POP1, putative [Plasmodium berghei]|uniref:Ribonucleases P/MRP protein subunit POP1, putative n=1 Tax=Plasmodium berghei TaxID=5821 RepID=A0A1D3SJA5_PLABE|nr:ribonucleases P/MRP protein subunit POP1, putative [Plasmodium berghei]